MESAASFRGTDGRGGRAICPIRICETKGNGRATKRNGPPKQGQPVKADEK